MIKRLLAFALALVVFACTEPDYIPPQGGDEPDGTEIPKLPSEVDDIYQPNDYAKARAEVLKRGRGYYKDVFMDGGINLTSRRTLPATDFLGVSLEYFASAASDNVTKTDTLLQHQIFTGSADDTNGWLLYPDGAPRYRMIYVNGGKAASHAKSMEKSSRENICQYIAAGGSYIGTCAGAFIASRGVVSNGEVKNTNLYFGLWPGYTYNTKLNDSRTHIRIEENSPLLRYFDFGLSKVVESVYHNGGCYVKDEDVAEIRSGADVLSRYLFEDTSSVKIRDKICTWSYKANESSGRVISCGSHPEGITEGERRDYMAAMMLYAMDGNAAPQPKGELKAGKVREMNKRTEDNAPEYTRIGDGQYHHFTVNVPSGCNKMVVSIEGYAGEDNFDLLLCGKSGELAYSDNATHKSDGAGCSKQLEIDAPSAGEWYVSVYCATMVDSAIGDYGTEYSGRLDVLNGVPYKISVSFE